MSHFKMMPVLFFVAAGMVLVTVVRIYRTGIIEVRMERRGIDFTLTREDTPWQFRALLVATIALALFLAGLGGYTWSHGLPQWIQEWYSRWSATGFR